MGGQDSKLQLTIGTILATLTYFGLKYVEPIIPQPYRPTINVLLVLGSFYCGYKYGPGVIGCSMLLVAMAIGG